MLRMKRDMQGEDEKFERVAKTPDEQGRFPSKSGLDLRVPRLDARIHEVLLCDDLPC